MRDCVRFSQISYIKNNLYCICVRFSCFLLVTLAINNLVAMGALDDAVS